MPLVAPWHGRYNSLNQHPHLRTSPPTYGGDAYEGSHISEARAQTFVYANKTHGDIPGNQPNQSPLLASQGHLATI